MVRDLLSNLLPACSLLHADNYADDEVNYLCKVKTITIVIDPNTSVLTPSSYVKGEGYGDVFYPMKEPGFLIRHLTRCRLKDEFRHHEGARWCVIYPLAL